MITNSRIRPLARILLLALIGLGTSACYFDGHFGHCHGWRAPVRHCR